MMNQENYENHLRELGVLSDDRGRFSRNMARADNFGAARRRALEKYWKKQISDQSTDFRQRNLGSISLAFAKDHEKKQEYQDNLTALEDALSKRKGDIDERLSGDQINRMERLLGAQRASDRMDRGEIRGNEAERLQFLERIEESYPDISLLAALSQAYGAGGGIWGPFAYGQSS